jgi:hypothetical protein
VVAGPVIGLLAALVYALSVNNLILNDNLRFYALSVALAAVSLAAFAGLVRDGVLRADWRLLSSAWLASSLAGLFTSYFFIAVLGAQLVVVLALRTQRRRGLWSTGFSAIGFLFIWWAGQVLANILRAAPTDVPPDVRFVSASPLQVVLESGRQLAANQFTDPGWWVPAAVVAVVVVVGVVAWSVRRVLPADGPERFALAACLLIVAGVLVISLALAPYDEDLGVGRLVAISLPAWAVLVPTSGWVLAGGRRWGALAATGAVVVVGLLSLPAYRALPTPALEIWDPIGVAKRARELARPDDLVVYSSPEQAGYYAWTQGLQRPNWIWTRARSFEFLPDMRRRVDEQLSAATPGRPVLWFVSMDGQPVADAPVVGWLRANAYPAGAEVRSRTTISAWAINAETPRAVGGPWQLDGGIRLVSASVSPAADPGGSAVAELVWQASQPVQRSLSVFVHVLDRDGRRVAGHDGPPANGQAPSTEWGAEPVVDRHGLVIPESIAPGEYQVVAGLYDAAGRVRQAGGESLISLGRLRIQ